MHDIAMHAHEAKSRLHNNPYLFIRNRWKYLLNTKIKWHFCFRIINCCNKGAVLSISVKEGGIRVGTLLSIGPAYSLHYEPVEVKSVWRMGEPVEELRKRQTGTISIKNARPAKKIDFVVTKENIRRVILK